MREGWELKKLGEVAKIIYGYTEKTSFEEVGPKFLRITDIQDDGVNWDTVPFCKINDADFDKYKLSDGDIVFARTGATTGKSYLVNDPPKSVFASYLIKVHMNSRNLTPQYLFQFFQTKEYWDVISAGVAGAAQGGFNATKLSDLEIPLPPLPEQQRIVAILDEAFAAIAKAKANAEQNLKNAKELFESYLQGVFEQRGEGWRKYKVSELCESIIDCVNKTAPIVPEETDYKMIRTTNIRFGQVDLTTVRYVAEDTYKEWTRRQKPQKGDILFTREAPMGEVGMLCTNDKVFLGQRIVSYRVDKMKVDPKFLLLAFQSLGLKKQIDKLASGATVQHLRVPHTKEFEFNIPPLIVQQSIVQKLDALSAQTKKLEAIYQQKINDLEELKKSILQKAFSGELKTAEMLAV